MKPKNKRQWILWSLAALFAAMTVIGLIPYHGIADWGLKLFLSDEVNLDDYRTYVTLGAGVSSLLMIITLAVDEMLSDTDKAHAKAKEHAKE